MIDTAGSTTWPCACGTKNASVRLRCAGCGAGRPAAGGAPASAPQTPAFDARPEPPKWSRLARDSGKPLPPNVPGAVPVSFTTRSLLFEMPTLCCCCLAGTNRTLDVVATKTEVNWLNVALTTLGLLLAVAVGQGFRMDQHSESYSGRFRIPCCPSCRSHALFDSIGWVVGLGLGVVAAFVLVLAQHESQRSFGATVLVGCVVAVIGGFASRPLLSRLGPGCAKRTPVSISWRNEEFRFSFASKSWGERVLELNAPRGTDPPGPSPRTS